MENMEIRGKLHSIYNELRDKFNFSCESLEIVISSRLRSSNGYCRTGRFILHAKIVMSRVLLDEFGWETFERSFRHEVAHIANRFLYNGSSHNGTFKQLCRNFGGTMNNIMAGETYKDCASSDYVKPIIRYEYHCSCGFVAKRTKRMSIKKRTKPTHTCRGCGELVMNWKEKRVV